MLCMGLLCYAFPNPKDTIYTNVESLMKEVRTTKNKTATYYLVLKDGEEKEVKVRIDLKQIDCEIPLYKSESFDIKKLMVLKEESLTKTNQKLKVIDAKKKEGQRLTNEVNALTKELDALKADTLSLDSVAIAKVEEDLQDKMRDFKKVDAEVRKIFKEYEAMMDSLMGNLRTQYHERLVMAMEEAYEKIENKETTFKSVDDDGTFWDIRLDLLKIDATREMKIPRRLDSGDETIEQITAGKLYYLLHFAEFGSMFEEEEVKKVFSAIKLWEFHLNPYLVDKQFGLVCDDQYRTQHYINSVVDYKNYSGNLVIEEEYDTDTEWISQYDCEKIKEIIGINCRCVPVGNKPSNNCCNQTGRAILKNEGAKLTGGRIIIVDTDTDGDCKTTSNSINYKKGLEHMNASLANGFPVLVGVQKFKRKNDTEDWVTKCTSYSNNPKSSNHYLVIVSRKGNQYRYYEVGTQHEFKGKAETNIFYDLGGFIESNEMNNKKYRITDVRVNKLD